MLKAGPCIVCTQRTSNKCRPFGVLTEIVWAHDYHDAPSIQRAWMAVNAADTLSLYLVAAG